MSHKVNKSAEIRKLLKEMDSPTEIAKQLRKQGIRVSPGYVSSLKSKQLQSPLGRRKPGRPAKSSRTNDAALEIAFDLVLSVGPNQANQLVDAAEQLLTKIRSHQR